PTPSHHRFSFTANGIAVFYPNEFVDERSIKTTFSKSGEPLLPEIKEPEEERPACWDLSSAYNKLGQLVTVSKSETASPENNCDALFSVLRLLAEQGVSEDQLVEALGKKIVELHENHAKA